MLKNTFVHIKGVSEETEKKLWDSGILTWEEFLKRDANVHNKEHVADQVRQSIKHYEMHDHEFFLNGLLHKHHWRAYPDTKCCFLDIETTGLSKYSDEITVIGLYDGQDSKIFINGQNMDKFEEELAKYNHIITFNGYTFDMPFILQKFPALRLNHFHTDLRFVLRNLGYSGGLKRIEKSLNIARPDDLDGMDGLEAVRLWHRYRRHDDKDALDRLVRYNIEDIKNLKTIMEFSYGSMRDLHTRGRSHLES